MKEIDSSLLVNAVLRQDAAGVRNALEQGCFPDTIHGTLPLVTHAALKCDSEIFHLLIDAGAEVPSDFLSQIVNWELGDWRITSDDEESRMADIILAVKETTGWPSLEQRQRLVACLDGFHLPQIKSILLT